MKEVAYMLFGAAFTLAASYAAGRVLLERLGIDAVGRGQAEPADARARREQVGSGWRPVRIVVGELEGGTQLVDHAGQQATGHVNGRHGRILL